jgi:hypothetical protein
MTSASSFIQALLSDDAYEHNPVRQPRLRVFSQVLWGSLRKIVSTKPFPSLISIGEFGTVVAL